ncbi:MAG: TRAP transporter large permease subunit [Acidaminobacter sp.]|uniref:TRAP transporter large permease n=1 Tax=Acidaminobacter sp. TaxID=1872102 RepID=UPI001382727B|nr:TRAP transporter large permease [Acidaminobacter sp.]MZQ99090.1 TRAP transporter large permease subunit [Acidaminobacter sp.]
MGGILFGTALLLLVVGAPIVTALGLSSLVFIYVNDIQHVVVIQKLFAGIDSAALLAVPFFILAGDLMNQGGIAKRIVNMAASAVGNIHGGLGIVAIISCMFFAAISGSGIATAAAIGGVMMTGMLRAGYSRSFSATIVAAASPIGIIIPPSIAFIIYAVLSKVAVSDLYKVGLPAGMIVGAALVVPTILVSKKRGYQAKAEQIAAGEIEIKGLVHEKEGKKLTGMHYFLDSLWALGTPVIIVGGVFAGIFTPTESAVVAVIYSIIIGIFVYKEMKWKDLPRIFLASAISTAGIMVIMAAAALFAWVMVYVKIPQTILDTVLALTSSRYTILLIINIIVLIAGMFMESGSIQYILVPIALPIALTLGIDPVHFGIMLTTNLAIGMLTPPFGITLFTSARVFGTSIQDVTRETLPFLIALLVAQAIITFIPQSVMWIL